MAYELLFALFARVTLSGQAVVAKVWSTNLKYVHILEQMGFRCVRKVADDAGQDIDLLFYEKNFNSRQAGVIKRLSACHALASAIASIVLFSVAVLSVVGFVAFRQCSVVASELFLALATSLTASSICILVETVHRLNSAEADRFLIDMKELGIERLSFNKQELLFDAIRNARKTIWISGYRHIITSGLRAEIQSALRRGVDVRILSSAPWKKSYKQIYGNDMSVIKSYIKIAELILCGNSCSSAQGQCLIRYSSKVHFNDIYRIDNTFITSPYFYAGSRLDCGSGGIATARDFFTVVVSNESDLWHLTENEFDRLWQSAEEELDQDSFTLHFSDRAYTRRRDKDNCKLLRDCLKKRQ